VTCRTVRRVKVLYGHAQARGRRKILVHEIQPCPARGVLQFGGMSCENCREVLLPARHDGARGEIATNGRDGHLEFRKRALRDDLGTVDRQSGAAGRGDVVIDTLESGVALIHPLRALRGALGKLLTTVDMV
jgi:hypothetical protein